MGPSEPRSRCCPPSPRCWPPVRSPPVMSMCSPGALRRLEPETPPVAERAGWLADLAARTTPDELQRVVAVESVPITADGMSRLEHVSDAPSGCAPGSMTTAWWCLKGEFDRRPVRCCTDASTSHDSALRRTEHLMTGAQCASTPRFSGPRVGCGDHRRWRWSSTGGGEVVVVVDATAVQAEPWSIGLRRLSSRGGAPGSTSSTPTCGRSWSVGGSWFTRRGRLVLSRARHPGLANRAQRRVLRGPVPNLRPGLLGPVRSVQVASCREHDGNTDLADPALVRSASPRRPRRRMGSQPSPASLPLPTPTHREYHWGRASQKTRKPDPPHRNADRAVAGTDRTRRSHHHRGRVRCARNSCRSSV